MTENLLTGMLNKKQTKTKQQLAIDNLCNIYCLQHASFCRPQQSSLVSFKLYKNVVVVVFYPVLHVLNIKHVQEANNANAICNNGSFVAWEQWGY